MLQNFLKKFKKKENRIHHFIFIESTMDVVVPQVVFWGEAGWWPLESGLQVTRKTPGDIRVGTQYEQCIKAFLSCTFDVEITQFEPNRVIEKTFVRGFIKGRESLTIESRYNGTKVMYEMVYDIKGFMNKILWFWFKEIHEESMKMVLEALKSYCQAQKRL